MTSTEKFSNRKTSFRFNELVSYSGVRPYVLRYWETEFPQIAPKIFSGGEKLYSEEDVAVVLEVKRLLFDKKFSIERARKSLQERKLSNPPATTPALENSLTTSQSVSKIIRVNPIVSTDSNPSVEASGHKELSRDSEMSFEQAQMLERAVHELNQLQASVAEFQAKL